MIQIICGEKGKGKTKVMLEKANEAVTKAEGLVVFLDKNLKHSYELNNSIRLINVLEYPVTSYEGFIGFISGLISGNHDIETVFLDSSMTLSHTDESTLEKLCYELEKISGATTFVLSVSLNGSSIPEALKDSVIESL